MHRAIAEFLIGLLAIAVVLGLAWRADAEPRHYPDVLGTPNIQDLPDKRRVAAIEGYGLRCTIVWVRGVAGMAASGSGTVSCLDGKYASGGQMLGMPMTNERYYGPWRYVEPRE